jgi:hypothetical protein
MLCTLRDVTHCTAAEAAAPLHPCPPLPCPPLQEDVDRLAAMCAEAGSWLVLDNTYEQFVYGGGQHYCAAGPHVINLFSFSKVG